MRRHSVLSAVLLLPFVTVACTGGDDDSARGDSDLESFLKAGEMSVEFDGAEYPVDLEVMDIFVVEDEAQYPEIWHFHGSGIDLAGEFPMDLHVGYEEAIERMEGREIEITPTVDLGPGLGIVRSQVTVDGRQWPVAGGTLRFTKHIGDPSDAGEVIAGEAALQLVGGRTVAGTFTVLAKTWG